MRTGASAGWRRLARSRPKPTLVLDTWPLTTTIAGLYSEKTKSPGIRESLRDLCVAGAYRFETTHVEALYRALSTAAELVTTGPVLTETFHHLERASRDEFGDVLTWTASRFEKLRIVEVDWPRILTHSAAAPFGLADASVLALTERLRDSVLLLQDGRLHDFCIRRQIRAKSCLDLVVWKT